MGTKPTASDTPSWSSRVIRLLGTTRFFWIVVVLFGLQSVWIALSARYPQAFDEQFHFGIINIYSYHLSPFWSSQPTSADRFGAIMRDPSFLYQYLLSFPLRLIRLFTNNLTDQIIILRLLNVALFGSGLFVMRRLLRLAKASAALTHVILLFLVLTPVVPLLASQINYDNLMIPITTLAVYLTAKFSQQVRLEKRWSWEAILRLSIVCLFAGVVKYAFLPIFLAIVIWLALDWRWLRRNNKGVMKEVLPWTAKRYILSTLYCLLLLIAATLSVERYGINVVRYHTPIPECGQVLSVQRCQAYGPWARNYMYAQQSVHLPLDQVLTYPFIWMYHSMNELIFTISSSFNSMGAVDYHVGTQLIVIEVLAWMVFTTGVLAVAFYARRLAKDRLIRRFTLVIALYVAALGGQNYMDYIHLGYPVAIHGRYLLPILPLLYLVVARGFRYSLQQVPADRISIAARKVSVVGMASALLLFEGGGFVTYIVRSDPSWFWPQSSKAQTANDKVRKILKPIVVDVKKK